MTKFMPDPNRQYDQGSIADALIDSLPSKRLKQAPNMANLWNAAQDNADAQRLLGARQQQGASGTNTSGLYDGGVGAYGTTTRMPQVLTGNSAAPTGAPDDMISRALGVGRGQGQQVPMSSQSVQSQQRPPMELSQTMGRPDSSSELAQPGDPGYTQANPAFRPPPMPAGQRNAGASNVADNTAAQAIGRAAAARARNDPNAEQYLNQLAGVAWQREAAANGNPSGDTSAPDAYVESWKGMLRNGENTGDLGTLYNAASANAKQRVDAEQALAAQVQARHQQVLATNAADQAARSEQVRQQQMAAQDERARQYLGLAPGITSASDALIHRALQVGINPATGDSTGMPPAVTNQRGTAAPASSAAPVVIDHSSPQAYMNSFVPAAKAALAAKGLPESLAPILAAIPRNEQGWQKDAPGNNYYGIKGKNTQTGASTGPVETWEDYGNGRQNIKDTFRAYNNPTESVQDFLQFLEDNPRYKQALAIGRQTGDPSQFIHAIHAAGYATDPQWANKILSIASEVK